MFRQYLFKFRLKINLINLVHWVMVFHQIFLFCFLLEHTRFEDNVEEQENNIWNSYNQKCPVFNP